MKQGIRWGRNPLGLAIREPAGDYIFVWRLFRVEVIVPCNKTLAKIIRWIDRKASIR